MELFDVGPAVALSVIGLTAAIVAATLFYFVHSAPPTSITISSGPEGSAFNKYALKYAKILGDNGVKVDVLTSEGSFQNLTRLLDPAAHVDVAIVQAGILLAGIEKLVTLGSIAYQPILVFSRGARTLELLSELKGRKIAVGPQGSGTRNFALALLAANGIKDDGSTATLLDWEAEKAASALEKGEIDAAFIMSESASTDILHRLLREQDVRLYSFKQASAYSRKIDYLNALDLPEGAIDLGLDIPPRDVTLLGPMIELVATRGLHPALSDLLLEAATQVHGRPGIFQKRGEFPAPIEHSIRVSQDATRFFKSGKSFLYRYLPFWLASLTDRIMFVLLPMLVFLVPALRSIPAFFQWRMRTKIHRHYRDLLRLENEFVHEGDSGKREEIRHHFDRIEESVNRMKVRAAFADQYYALRGHIDFVRQLLARRQA